MDTSEPIIVECKIGPYPRQMPEGMSDPMTEVTVKFDNGEEKILFSFYPDEITYKESEFIGLGNLQKAVLGDRIRQKINQKLKDIGKKLELSQPLNLGSARDCYSNTLYRNNTDMKKISQMLGHSNVVITEHYLAGLNPDVTFGNNDPIL